MFCLRSSPRPEQAPLVTGLKITLSTNHSESPDGHYGILVLSQQAAIDQDQTDGNTTYLANLQTRKTLGEIRGTDYFENQNHRDLQVVWASDSSTCVLQYDGRYGFDSVLVLELKGESFRQIDVGKHIQKTLARLFDGYVNAYFRFGPDHKLKVRALSFTNPKALPDQPNDYAVFPRDVRLKGRQMDPGECKKNRRVRCAPNRIPGRFPQAHDRRRKCCRCAGKLYWFRVFIRTGKIRRPP